jgi:hypothetical protein
VLERLKKLIAFIKSLRLKNLVNSFRWPAFLRFFILSNGKPNPTLEESLAEAPPKEGNWDRIGFGKVAFGRIKVWHLPFIILFVWASEQISAFVQGVIFFFFGTDYFFARYLQFLCETFSRWPVVIVMGWVLLNLFRDLKK